MPKINKKKILNLSAQKRQPGAEHLSAVELHSAEDHLNAPTALNVDWENENTGTIFVRVPEDGGQYGIAIAVEKYPMLMLDRKFKSLMAKKYRKEGKLGLSVMIAHNQEEYDDIQKRFGDEG